MKIALHVPCYINELNPQIAKKTLLILRHFKLDVSVPANQTCCGQPFINSGQKTTLPLKFNEIFKDFDYIVSPSSSCTSTIRAQNLEVSKKMYEEYKVFGPYLAARQAELINQGIDIDISK